MTEFFSSVVPSVYTRHTRACGMPPKHRLSRVRLIQAGTPPPPSPIPLSSQLDMAPLLDDDYSHEKPSADSKEQTCYIKWLLITFIVYVIVSLTATGVIAYVVLSPTIQIVEQVNGMTKNIKEHESSWIQTVDNAAATMDAIVLNSTKGTLPKELLGVDLAALVDGLKLQVSDVLTGVTELVNGINKKGLSLGIGGLGNQLPLVLP